MSRVTFFILEFYALLLLNTQKFLIVRRAKSHDVDFDLFYFLDFVSFKIIATFER